MLCGCFWFAHVITVNLSNRVWFRNDGYGLGSGCVVFFGPECKSINTLIRKTDFKPKIRNIHDILFLY